MPRGALLLPPLLAPAAAAGAGSRRARVLCAGSVWEAYGLRDDSSCAYPEAHVSYDGDDVVGGGAGWAAGSLQRCCDLCNAEPRCAHFTFRNSTGRCHPKSSDAGRTEGVEGSVSGARSAPSPKPALAAPLAGACDSGAEVGYDYAGHDLYNQDASSVGDCCDLCAADNSCTCFSFSKDWGKCYLKNSDAGRQERSGFISGKPSGTPPAPTPPPGPGVSCTAHSDLDCKDEDLDNGHHSDVSDAAACCALCSARSDCTTWSLYPGQKNCYLKSGCNNPTAKSDCVSGGSTKSVPTPSPPGPPAPPGKCTADTWTGAGELPDMPCASGEIFATVAGGKLYVAGEEHDDCDFPTMVYDFARRSWSKAASRPKHGNHHTAELIGDDIVVFGGFDGDSSGKVQVLDTTSGKWSTRGDMPWSTGSACSALIGGTVYVCGGIIGNGQGGTVQTCYSYNPGSDKWSKFDSMPQGRNHAACATDGKRLWMFGGRTGNNVPQNGFNTVEVYDPSTGQWESSDSSSSELKPLPQRRGGMGRAVYTKSSTGEEEFYVIGGETSNDPEATSKWVYDRVDIYNPRTNSWRLGRKMPDGGRHGIYPAYYDGRIYMAGGGIHHGNSQSKGLFAYCV